MRIASVAIAMLMAGPALGQDHRRGQMAANLVASTQYAVEHCGLKPDQGAVGKLYGIAVAEGTAFVIDVRVREFEKVSQKLGKETACTAAATAITEIAAKIQSTK